MLPALFFVMIATTIYLGVDTFATQENAPLNAKLFVLFIAETLWLGIFCAILS